MSGSERKEIILYPKLAVQESYEGGLKLDFIHADFWGKENDVAIVTLDNQANVMLLDDINFSAYKQGSSFKYYGGWACRSPVRLKPPHYGHWHVIIDLGGSGGKVCANIRFVRTLEQGVLF